MPAAGLQFAAAAVAYGHLPQAGSLYAWEDGDTYSSLFDIDPEKRT